MDLHHQFQVPTSVSETWDHFNDIAAVAECFPGAQVTSVDGDTFEGTVKVKLGPIALQYKGSGTFVEKDESARRFKVEAKGKDKRGNGTAGANVTLTMAEADGGGTSVDVVTDLNVTGKPAQFGRGVMQDVSDKLLGQFVSCLEKRLAEPEPVAEPEPAAAAPAAASAGSGQDSASDSGQQDEAPKPDQPQPAPAPPVAPTPPAGATSTPPPSPPRTGGGAHAASSDSDDALDLGTTVLPVLAKLYWKQALGGLLVVFVLWRLLRRCKG